MGAILDPDELVPQPPHPTFGSLAPLGVLRPVYNCRGAQRRQYGHRGKVTGVARSSVSFPVNNDKPVQVVPHETVSGAAFDQGADEVAGNLAEALVHVSRGRR